MRYRSHLSAAERAYARSFYPVFEDLKTILLRVAASTLLWLEDREYAATYLEVLRQSAHELGSVQRQWTTGNAALTRDTATDHAAVAAALSTIGETLESLQRTAVTGERTHMRDLVDTLLAEQAKLRHAALALWPLELVPETGALAGPHQPAGAAVPCENAGAQSTAGPPLDPCASRQPSRSVPQPTWDASHHPLDDHTCSDERVEW